MSETVRCRKLILDRDIGWMCRCAISYCDRGMTFDLGSTKTFSTAIFETYFYHKNMWVTATDYNMYNMYIHLIVLSPLTVIFQLINFTVSELLIYFLMLSSCYGIVLFWYFVFTYIFSFKCYFFCTFTKPILSVLKVS